jgi:hypothetical protein
MSLYKLLKTDTIILGVIASICAFTPAYALDYLKHAEQFQNNLQNPFRFMQQQRRNFIRNHNLQGNQYDVCLDKQIFMNDTYNIHKAQVLKVENNWVTVRSQKIGQTISYTEVNTNTICVIQH